jgi:hypothetical protein
MIRERVGGVHELRAWRVRLLIVKIVLSRRWNRYRVLLLLVWCVSTEVRWFIFGGHFFFSLSSLSNSKLALFVFYFLASILFLLISFFFLAILLKFCSFQFSHLILIFRVSILSLLF